MWRIWKIKINKWNWPIPSCINPPKFMYIFIWTQPGAILPFTINDSKKARSRLDWEDIWSLFQCCGHHLGWWVKRPHPKAASSYCQRAAKSTKAKSIRENVDVRPGGGAGLLHSRRASPHSQISAAQIVVHFGWPNSGKWILQGNAIFPTSSQIPSIHLFLTTSHPFGHPFPFHSSFRHLIFFNFRSFL